MTKTVATPRLSSTLLLLRESPMEVLMVRRNSKATFASALVFPGGVVSPEDYLPEWRDHATGWDDYDELERAMRIAAFRETFEETGILCAEGTGGEVPAAADSFLDVVRASSGRLPLDQLTAFAHWVTPGFLPKRFDTRFYIFKADPQHEGVSDGAETVALEWQTPQHLLETEADLPFATRLNLMLLAECDDFDRAQAAAQDRKLEKMEPWLEQRADGAWLVIPEGTCYPVSEWLHLPAA